MTAHRILVLTPDQARERRDALAALLADAVLGGASVNFVWPMDHAKAAAWWEGALASHARGERSILTAELAGSLDGTVQVIPAIQENQAHRADIAKMLVHRRARRQGLGAALLLAAEVEARRLGRTLLTLDTETGSAGERLYARMGWVKFGEVPGYAASTDGSRQDGASFFYKRLDVPA
ncbi:MAG: GNAT family N-acetyltransferase [Geminicoccaceae bacterium]